MELNWFESLIYGLVSGVTEFLPVSSSAHQALMMKMFGTSGAGNLLTLLVRLAVLLAVFTECRHHIELLRREQRLAATPKRRRRRQPDQMHVLELRLIKTALVPLLLGFFFYLQARQAGDLLLVCIFLTVNGAMLFLPQLVRNANKDARRMTMLDGILFGICGAFAVLPGISRVGVISSAAVARGVDKEHALNWSLLLSIPALVCLAGFDIFAIINGGIGSFGILAAISALLAVVAAYLGARFAIRSMRTLSRRIGFSGYAYYCWGSCTKQHSKTAYNFRNYQSH